MAAIHRTGCSPEAHASARARARAPRLEYGLLGAPARLLTVLCTPRDASEAPGRPTRAVEPRTAATHHVANLERTAARDVTFFAALSIAVPASAAPERHATTAIADRAGAWTAAPGGHEDQLDQAGASEARWPAREAHVPRSHRLTTAGHGISSPRVGQVVEECSLAGRS